MATIYNATDGPLTIDRAGRILGAREHGDGDVDAQPVKGHVEAGRMVHIETPAQSAGLDDSSAKATGNGRRTSTRSASEEA